ncbi:hypothetical protein D3C84_551450 [compost metagenome]
MAMVGFFQKQQNLADREQAQHQYHELNAVGQVHAVAGKTVYAAVGIDADTGKKQANQCRDEGFQWFVTCHAAQADNGKDHQHKVLRRAKGNGPLGQ